MTESTSSIVHDLKTRYRGVPILTLAQTALWDDPIKALFKGLLDEHAHGTRLLLGIMDTDYFSRLPRPPAGAPPFDLLPHSDVATRDMWSAVGEMSCLLGAETPIPLSQLAAWGVHLGKAAAATGQPVSEFANALTEAWGWRGLAQTQGRRVLAGDVRLKDLEQPLLRQMDWALSETSTVADRVPGAFAADMRGFVADYVRDHPDGNLADLYLAFLPRLYATLLGYDPQRLELARSSELLRFNRQTARRKRFRPLDLFLDPILAPMVRRHYNTAVHNSGIATLDRFGSHAVPFDLAVPGHGRGTLHIAPAEIRVDTDEPIVIPLREPITDRRHLAVLLEHHLGKDVALLGKAVVLITMLAGEYIFLFNETGSPYVQHSCAWNRLLSEDGAGLTLYPILRLGVRPWDTLSEAGGTLLLPDHMRPFFGTDKALASDFAACWTDAVRAARDTLETIASLPKPADWIRHLAQISPGTWTEEENTYRTLTTERANRGRTIAAINETSRGLLHAIRQLRDSIHVLERAKGDHFREYIQPAHDEIWKARREGRNTVEWEIRLDAAMEERSAREREIAEIQERIRPLLEKRRELAEQRKKMLSDPASHILADRLDDLENRAEAEKARMVREAWMTSRALETSEMRPSAWWFPVVDPSGAWFREVARTAAFRWQSLSGDGCPEAEAQEPLTQAVVTI